MSGVIWSEFAMDKNPRIRLPVGNACQTTSNRWPKFLTVLEWTTSMELKDMLQSI